GNATFSGSLQTESVTSDYTTTRQLSARDATVSGRLTADIIAANTIEGLDDKVSSITSEYIDKYQKSRDITPPSSVSAQFSLTHLPTDFIDVATVSAQFALIQEGLVSMGPSTFTDVSVM